MSRLPEYNNNDHCDHSIIQQYYFCKRGLKHFAYIILQFSFFSSCEKNLFILDRLEAEMKITSTWHVQNDWMNEWTGRPFWSEISTTVKTLLQNKLTLVYAILGCFFARYWTKIAVVFASFWGKWFPGARFCLFGPSRRSSRLGSHMKIYLDLTFLPMCTSGIANGRLCWTLRQKQISPLSLL